MDYLSAGLEYDWLFYGEMWVEPIIYTSCEGSLTGDTGVWGTPSLTGDYCFAMICPSLITYNSVWYYIDSYHIKMWMVFSYAFRNLLLLAIFTASSRWSIVNNCGLQYLYLLGWVWKSHRRTFILIRLWYIKVHRWIVRGKPSSSTNFLRWHLKSIIRY